MLPTRRSSFRFPRDMPAVVQMAGAGIDGAKIDTGRAIEQPPLRREIGPPLGRRLRGSNATQSRAPITTRRVGYFAHTVSR